LLVGVVFPPRSTQASPPPSKGAPDPGGSMSGWAGVPTFLAQGVTIASSHFATRTPPPPAALRPGSGHRGPHPRIPDQSRIRALGERRVRRGPHPPPPHPSPPSPSFPRRAGQCDRPTGPHPRPCHRPRSPRCRRLVAAGERMRWGQKALKHRDHGGVSGVRCFARNVSRACHCFSFAEGFVVQMHGSASDAVLPSK